MSTVHNRTSFQNLQTKQYIKLLDKEIALHSQDKTHIQNKTKTRHNFTHVKNPMYMNTKILTSLLWVGVKNTTIIIPYRNQILI